MLLIKKTGQLKVFKGISFRLDGSKKVILALGNKWAGGVIPERWNSKCKGTETGENLE